MLKEFIKGVEVWVPGETGLELALGSAHYGSLKAFERASADLRFGFDEGLPGKTWAQGRPIVLTDLHNSFFLRGEAAREDNVVCAISFPLFCGDYLLAVVVLFCVGDAEVSGAVEVWENPSHSDNELRLFDGYYGELEKFEWVSRRLTIMRGRGLPGTAWAESRPVIIPDIGNSNSFLRSSHAADAGISTGFAIPFFRDEQTVQVLAFLSVKGTPIARRFEVWLPDAEGQHLHFDSGHCYLDTDLAAKYADQAIARGQGPLGAAWLTGRPQVSALAPDEGEALIALPVNRGGRLASVVVLAL